MLKRGILTTFKHSMPSLMGKLKMHSSSRIVLCSAYDKHLPSPHVPTPIKKLLPQDTDILLDELLKASSLERTLQLVSQHLDVMNSTHIVACFSSIHGFIRVQTSEPITLTENEAFQDLCANMMKVLRNLDPQEILTVYKTLAGLKIRNNTFVMVSVLKMLGAHLNNMSLSQLNFLSFLLNKQRPNALIDGLKLALPLVLQVQIDQQIDSDNIGEIVNCLRLASKSRLKTTTIEKIISALLDGVNNLTSDHGVTIIFSLLNLQSPVDGYKELIEASFNIVTKDADELDCNSFLQIVRLCRNQNFYHFEFLSKAAKNAVSQKWDFEQSYELVNFFYHLDISDPPLLDYLCELLCSEANTFHINPKYSPLNFVEYFTATGYKPARIEEALSVLYSNKKKINKIFDDQPHLALKFVSCLAMLDFFPSDLLFHVTNEDYIFRAWSLSKQHGRSMQFERNLFSLVWSLEAFDQSRNFSIPSSILKKATSMLQQRCIESEYPLAKFIENGLGGSQFLQSGVFTRDGHVFDHVLAMRSGCYPVSLHDSFMNSGNRTNSIAYVEDMQLPNDVNIIPIIVAKEDQYCKYPEVLRGPMEIQIKSLIKKSYSPVVINYKTWENLPDREKIPYLMREIKQVFETEKTSQTHYVHDSF